METKQQYQNKTEKRNVKEANRMKVKKYPYTARPGWSYSRAKMLRQCPRQHWFHYYGAKYGGKALSEEVERIKSLTSLPLAAGQAVHLTIAETLATVAAGRNLSPTRRLVKRGKSILRSYLHSEDFVEKENGNGLDVDDVGEAFGRVKNTLTAFARNPLLGDIEPALRNRQSHCLVDPPGYGEFRLDGLKSYAKPDLMYQDGNDTTVVVDWKTGKARRRENELQLGGYLLYAQDMLDVPVEALEGRMVYLSSQEEDLMLAPSNGDLESVRERICREMSQIESYCFDVPSNTPKPMQEFPKASNHGCRWCKYREVCEETG